MGAQRSRLRQVLGPRAAEGAEFLLFCALVLPWLFAVFRPGAVPAFGLAAGGVFILGWMLISLRGGGDDQAARARNRGMAALCFAVVLAGCTACFIAFAPKKGAIEEWTPPAGTLETQFADDGPPPRSPSVN